MTNVLFIYTNPPPPLSNHIFGRFYLVTYNTCQTLCAAGAVLCQNDIQCLQQIYCVINSDISSPIISK